MNSFWWLWVAFVFFVLAPTVTWGWGYRGWGPPLPSFIQRRRHAAAQKQRARHERAAEGRVARHVDHLSWRWGGDAVWLFVLGAMIFALASYAWWA